MDVKHGGGGDAEPVGVPHPKKRKSNFRLEEGLRLKWLFLPEWIPASGAAAAGANQELDHKMQFPLLGGIQFLNVRRAEIQFLQHVALLVHRIMNLQYSTKKRFKQTLQCIRKTHVARLEDWLSVYFPLCCRIQGSPAGGDSRMSMSLQCFAMLRRLEYWTSMLQTQGEAALRIPKPDILQTQLTEQEDRVLGWLRVSFRGGLSSGFVDLAEWNQAASQLCAVASSLMCCNKNPGLEPGTLLELEHAARLWAHIHVQTRIVSNRWKKLSFSASPASRTRLLEYLKPLMRSMDESTKTAFSDLALCHAMVGGTREQYCTMHKPIQHHQDIVSELLASAEYSDSRQSREEDEEVKVHGCMRMLAGFCFTGPEMKALLQETCNADLWAMFQDAKHAWRPVLMLQVFSDSLRHGIHPSLDFLKWNYISPYLFWKRLPKVVTIQGSCPEHPASWDYPMVMPLLDGLFVQCRGPGSTLLRAVDMESALILFLALLQLERKSQLGDRISVSRVIESCVHPDDIQVVQKLL